MASREKAHKVQTISPCTLCALRLAAALSYATPLPTLCRRSTSARSTCQPRTVQSPSVCVRWPVGSNYPIGSFSSKLLAPNVYFRQIFATAMKIYFIIHYPTSGHLIGHVFPSIYACPNEKPPPQFVVSIFPSHSHMPEPEPLRPAGNACITWM